MILDIYLMCILYYGILWSIYICWIAHCFIFNGIVYADSRSLIEFPIDSARLNLKNSDGNVTNIRRTFYRFRCNFLAFKSIIESINRISSQFCRNVRGLTLRDWMQLLNMYDTYIPRFNRWYGQQWMASRKKMYCRPVEMRQQTTCQDIMYTSSLHEQWKHSLSITLNH